MRIFVCADLKDDEAYQHKRTGDLFYSKKRFDESMSLLDEANSKFTYQADRHLPKDTLLGIPICVVDTMTEAWALIDREELLKRINRIDPPEFRFKPRQ